MPPVKWMIGTVIFVCILTVFAFFAAVIMAYPVVTALIVAAIIAGTVYVMKKKRQRNLV